MPLTAAAATALVGGLQTGMGITQMIGQRRRERRAMENQIRLMDIQQQNQMELNRQGQQLQQETWEATNYGNQIEMLKQAGMNPALLYGKGGIGGVTGSQGGGSAASGNAPSIQPYPTMDISQIAKMASEIEVNKSIAKLNNTEADKKAGVDTEKTQAEIKAITQNIANEEVRNEILKIDQNLKELELTKSQMTFDAYIKKVHEELRELKGKADNSVVEGENAKRLQEDAIQRYKNEAYAVVLQNELARQGINKTKQEVTNLIEELQIKWKQLGLNERDVQVHERKVKIDKFIAEMNASTPSVGNVIGNMIWRFQDETNDMLGKEKYDRTGEKVKD